jgi:preprotein translocase subunit SecY
MYTRLATVPLAILQSFVIYSTLRGFGLVGTLTTIELVVMTATLTAGAVIMMWMERTNIRRWNRWRNFLLNYAGILSVFQVQ